MAFFVSFSNLCLAITRPVYTRILWNYHHSLAKHVFLPIPSAGTRIFDTETHLIKTPIFFCKNTSKEVAWKMRSWLRSKRFSLEFVCIFWWFWAKREERVKRKKSWEMLSPSSFVQMSFDEQGFEKKNQQKLYIFNGNQA